ncbi:MAG: DUF4247 domain-containing protein [Euzebya sp.]
MKWQSITAFVLGGVLLLGAAAAFATAGTVESFVADTFQSVDASVIPGASPRDRAYRSDQPVGPTAATIVAAWPPAERLDDPTGVYLRYRDSLIAVLPDPDGLQDGTAVITVDRLQEGYRRYYPYVGRRWGADRGYGGDFRGGGPGTGK